MGRTWTLPNGIKLRFHGDGSVTAIEMQIPGDGAWRVVARDAREAEALTAALVAEVRR